jgi:hypothetical protein
MLEIVSEGKNIFFRNLKVKIFGLKKYYGNDIKICQEIITECYNSKKDYFMASSGNYKVFYSRDFGWCIKSLINLGYINQVSNTLKYAIEKYHKYNNITVAISDNEIPFNFPKIYSPDSVAYFYRSLRIAKATNLITKYAGFLNNQLEIFELELLNNDGTLTDKHFSGMRDHIKTKQLCYDMIMACMLCDEVDKINKLVGKNIITNVLAKYDLKKKLIEKYWNGKYFIDSTVDNYCSGHANTYPYYLDIITDKNMLKSSIKSMQKNKLDNPIPLKYGYSNNTKFIWQEIFAPDWEKNTSWVMLGMAYIDIVSKIDKKKAKKYLKKYSENIRKNKCFIEVYSNKKPYQSLFFTSDDSMLWASIYLDLKQRLKD